MAFPNLLSRVLFSLSHQGQFRGQTPQFYSMAQHGVLTSYLLECQHPADTQLALAGLFYDAPRTFLGDVPSWVQEQFPAFWEAEDEFRRQVFGLLGVPLSVLQAEHLIKEAKVAAELMESAYLLEGTPPLLCGQNWLLARKFILEQLWRAEEAAVFLAPECKEPLLRSLESILEPEGLAEARRNISIIILPQHCAVRIRPLSPEQAREAFALQFAHLLSRRRISCKKQLS